MTLTNAMIVGAEQMTVVTSSMSGTAALSKGSAPTNRKDRERLAQMTTLSQRMKASM